MLPFPMFRSRSVDLALARQLIRLASLSPTSSTAFRAPRSPLRQRFSPTSCCSLTEQKESKTRATNSFVLKMIEGPTPATRFDSYTCKFKGGGYFFYASISPPAFAGPSFRARAHFRYNLSALAPSGLPMPCGCSSRSRFRGEWMSGRLEDLLLSAVARRPLSRRGTARRALFSFFQCALLSSTF